MDTDREFEHMMMSVRNSSGSITQMVYAANMLQIKLVQFVARQASSPSGTGIRHL